MRHFFDEVPSPDGSSGSVLQYAGIGSMYLTPVEVLFYHLLRKKGFDVDYLIYDESIPINEVITKEREEKHGKDKFWNSSCRDAVKLLNAASVQYETIEVSARAREIVDGLPDLNSILQFQHEEIDFGDIVCGAMYRYYKSLTFGENAETIARRMLVTSLSNYLCVQSRCSKKDYRFVTFSHGIYVTWQPVVEFCKREGIDFVCYDRAKTKGHSNFNVNQPSPDWSFDSAWERYADRKLTSNEQARVRQYLSDRELQQGDVYSYNFSERASNVEQEKQRLKIPLDRKCISIFTNLIWDAANVSRDIAFKDPFECVVETIKRFRNNDEIQVVLRSHPAEKVLGTRERYADLVREHFGDDLPTNVTLISPEDDVNSFTVIDMTDVGIVNTSTVGLEMAVLGKPVILISDTHYRGKGFTQDVESAESYFEAIQNSLEEGQISEDSQMLAEKYFFMMMFLYQHQMPTQHGKSGFEGFTTKRFSELSDSEPLVKIVEKLSGDLPTDFVFWPLDAPPAQSVS